MCGECGIAAHSTFYAFTINYKFPFLDAFHHCQYSTANIALTAYYKAIFFLFAKA